MNPELILVIGLAMVLLAIPSIVSAWSDGRMPRSSALTFLLGAALMVYAYVLTPGGYQITEIPTIIIRVIGGLLH